MGYHRCNLCGGWAKADFVKIASCFKDCVPSGSMPPPHVLRFLLGREAACPDSPVLHSKSKSDGEASCYRQVLDAWAAADRANAKETIGARRVRERRGEALAVAHAARARAPREAELELLAQTAGGSRMTIDGVLEQSGRRLDLAFVDCEAAAEAALRTPEGRRALAPGLVDPLEPSEGNMATVATAALIDAGMPDELAEERAEAMAPELAKSERRRSGRRTAAGAPPPPPPRSHEDGGNVNGGGASPPPAPPPPPPSPLSLSPGDAVEVQWKATESHPYGFWLGCVVSVFSPEGSGVAAASAARETATAATRDGGAASGGGGGGNGNAAAASSSSAATVDVLFQQYGLDSPWQVVYSVPLLPPGSNIDSPVNGDPAFGFVGGVRGPLTAAELGRWEGAWRSAEGAAAVRGRSRPARALSAGLASAAPRGAPAAGGGAAPAPAPAHASAPLVVS